MQQFYLSLSEKDRRRYAAIEAVKLGWGGISYISQLFKCDYYTIRYCSTLASQTKAGQNRWEVYYLKYQKENKVRKPNSDSTSVPDGAKQRAIANYQKQLNQEKTGQIKTGNKVSTSEFNRLLDSPDNQIKRIDQLESRAKPIAKPFGRYLSESCEHLRNLRMKSLFAPESIQGGISLSDWVNSQRLLFPLVCLGDGHDGVWNLLAEIGSTEMRQEILDWYHQCRKSLQGGWVDKTVKSCRRIIILKDTASHMARPGRISECAIC